MAFTFPEFTEPLTLEGQRSWTATFDSHDQRNDTVYYIVTVCDGGHELGQFVVQVDLYWAGDDWSGPGYTDRLQQELHEVAAAGRTNTDYTGRTNC